MQKMIFQTATWEDSDRLWEIIEPIIRAGETYVFSPDSSREKMLDYWLDSDKDTYVAKLDGEILGTFYLKANQPDRGSHVVNAGYMVAAKAGGRGIGRAMADFSFSEARRLGYTAMQFNYVISSNTIAVSLWEKLGFKIVGQVPDAFVHPKLGPTDVYVMYLKL
jgi:ribosomal protein S18 acetylase RimI-like enzyme